MGNLPLLHLNLLIIRTNCVSHTSDNQGYRGFIGLIADGSAVTCGQPWLNHGLMGLIANGSRIQPAATAGDLRSPDADNRILAVSRGGGRQISNWFDICYDHKAHLRPDIGSLAASELRSPGSCPKNGGRSLVRFCRNYT